MNTKRILITGAGTGIGKETTLQLLKKGHTVIATAQLLEDLNDLKEEGRDLPGDLYTETLAIEHPRQHAVLDKYKPDVLVNNAGIGEGGPLAEIPMERVRQNMEINVFATLELSQYMARLCIERGSGRIIIVGSTAGLITLPFHGAYNMTKYATEAMADALRMELSPFNIQVSLIEPGKIDTGFNQRMSAKKEQWMDDSSAYWRRMKDILAFEDEFWNNGEHPASVVARDIVHAVESTRPRPRYISPRSLSWLMHLVRMLPSRIRDRIFWHSTPFGKGW